ncbi:MAG: hypothetical protein ABJO09_15100 [Hyphomicrobiales bacterium]
MTSNAKFSLISSLVLFVIFFANVSFGAAGNPEFLGDIPQMLMLFTSAILFVIGVLLCEAQSEKE